MSAGRRALLLPGQVERITGVLGCCVHLPRPVVSLFSLFFFFKYVVYCAKLFTIPLCCVSGPQRHVLRRPLHIRDRASQQWKPTGDCYINQRENCISLFGTAVICLLCFQEDDAHLIRRMPDVRLFPRCSGT